MTAIHRVSGLNRGNIVGAKPWDISIYRVCGLKWVSASAAA